MTNQEPDVPRSVGRVLDILEAVLAQRSCTLTAAADATQLTPTTALRHLRALVARGYLGRDIEGTYTAGPTVLRLAASLHDSGPLANLLPAAQPHLDALAATTGESTYLAISDGIVATYIASAQSNRAIRHVGWIGQNVRLDGTAVGAAVASPGKVVVRSGAVESDITAVSLALPSADGMGIAVSVVGPHHRLKRNEARAVAKSLRNTVDSLCRDLGINNEEMAS